MARKKEKLVSSIESQNDEHKVFETPEEQILHRPGMWIGRTTTKPEEIYVFKNDQFEKQELDFNPGIAKLIEEVIVNSADEHVRTKANPKLRGWVLDKINVTVRENGQIRVWDNGGISIYTHSQTGEHSLESIFGRLFSSSNYEDDKNRETVGTNGVGASLANLFSTEFTAITEDGKNSLQIDWSNNKSNKFVHPIKSTKNHFTQIDYILELDRFGVEEIPQGVISYIERLCMVLAASYSGLEVTFNETVFKFDSYRQYVELYGAKQIIGEVQKYRQALVTNLGQNESENERLISDLDSNEFVHRGNIIKISNEQNLEIYLTPTYGQEPTRFGIVNGAECNSGTHIKGIENRIKYEIEDYVKKNKLKDLENLTYQQITSAYNLFVKITVDKPEYNSQSKDELTSDIRFYDKKLEKLRVPVLSKQTVDDMIKSDIFLYLEELAKAKNAALNNKELNKRAKELSKKNARSVRKLLDAGLSSTKKGKELCELWLFEGESAGSGFRPNRDPKHQGCYFLKGKALNSFGLTPIQILKNEEFSDIIIALGLNPKDPSDLSGLRYSKIIICTDMDYDGHSIVGQLFTLFGLHFPELFRQKMIYRAITPLWKTTKGSESNYFLTTEEFEQWSSKNKGFKTKYFKGIGSLKKEDYRAMLKNTRLEQFNMTDSSISAISTWLGKGDKYKAERKRLLLTV